MAPPTAIEEGALVDNVGTFPHGGDGLGVRLGKSSNGSVRERELDNSSVAGSQFSQLPSFMLKASPRQNLEFGVLPLRPLDLAASGGQLLLGEVLTLQKARQIGRADDQPVIKKLHLALLLQGSL
jgi:hypothetical protein